MVAMTGFAHRKVLLHKRHPVRGDIKQPGFNRMTEAADGIERCDSGRRGAVIAVTIVAGGRSQVAVLKQGDTVHGTRVFFQLIGGDTVLRHVRLVGMAVTARCGEILRVGGGVGQFGRAN